MDFIIFIVSMVALIYGADLVVVQSEKIALHYKISSYVIGASLVAVGTSLPEMAASISASTKGDGDIAVANVIGSGIFNISLILGLVFLLAKGLKPKRDIFTQDGAWSIFPIMFFILMSLDGSLSRIDGILLLLLMAGYLIALRSKKQDKEDLEEENELKKLKFNWYKSIFFLLIGFFILVVGANFAIDSAVNIATSLGVSKWAIGFFLVGFGTSLPELIVSLRAALKKNIDLAIGNVIGSNVANFSIVLGSAALVHPININLRADYFDISACVVATIMLVFICANKLYNKSAGVALLIILALAIQNGFA